MDRFRPRYFKYDKYKNLYSFIDYPQKIINLLFHSVMWETAGLTTTTTVSGKTTTETTQMKPTTLTSLQDGLFLQDQGTKHEETFENHLKGRSLTCGTTKHCFLRPALPVTGPQCMRIWITQGEKFKPTFAFRSPLTYLYYTSGKEAWQEVYSASQKNASMIPLFQNHSNLLNDTTLVVRRANRGLTHYMALARGMSDLYYWGLFNLFLFELLSTWE